jgi:hypothetical protein
VSSLDFQIDVSSFLVTRKFSEENADLVKAIVAADWLTARKVLPEKVTVADHLAHF